MEYYYLGVPRMSTRLEAKVEKKLEQVRGRGKGKGLDGLRLRGYI